MTERLECYPAPAVLLRRNAAADPPTAQLRPGTFHGNRDEPIPPPPPILLSGSQAARRGRDLVTTNAAESRWQRGVLRTARSVVIPGVAL